MYTFMGQYYYIEGHSTFWTSTRSNLDLRNTKYNITHEVSGTVVKSRDWADVDNSKWRNVQLSNKLKIFNLGAY